MSKTLDLYVLFWTNVIYTPGIDLPGLAADIEATLRAGFPADGLEQAGYATGLIITVLDGQVTITRR